MSTSSSAKETTIAGIYLSEYDKIVKPQQRFLIPNYFLEYWVRRLGLNLAWVVIALQQACWRADDDTCTMSQHWLSKETGISERTIRQELKHNRFRHWYIPQISHQKGTVNGNVYQPRPNQYTVFLSTPLIPEHLAGLYSYFQAVTPEGSVAEIKGAAQQLLKMPAREALQLLSEQPVVHTFDTPQSLNAVIQAAAGIDPAQLEGRGSIALQKTLESLANHLTEIGFTSCRQYFRLQWVPRLGPAMAWLVMALRSKCYFNPKTGEFRDVCTWKKKDLAAFLGQSNQNLRRLLKHRDADYFFQIVDNQKHRLSVRVALIKEPQTNETTSEYWAGNPQIEPSAENATNLPLTSTKNETFLPITQSQNATNLPVNDSKMQQNHRSPQAQTQHIFRSPSEKATNLPLFKDLKDSIPEKIQKDPHFNIDLMDIWLKVQSQLQTQLTQATYQTWVQGTTLARDADGIYCVLSPSQAGNELLENRYRSHIEKSLKLILPTEEIERLRFRVLHP